ncbi:class I SAM-dependent methyltransferase [Variovorax sp. GT1P44]|uniref:class I SAM-dependent methyltransferase n=1 Tax=Variovorax sp. GT1P44 TaxID=3443742 RepID=UPI003F474AB5
MARTAGAASVAVAIVACTAPAPPGPAPSALSSARIAEIVASPDRSDADRVNDKRRNPQEMLMFIGVRPGMKALDLSAAGGYTTELIARAVGPTGRVYGQSPPRPPASRPAQPEGAVQPMATDATPPPSGGPRPSPVALAERAKNPNAGNIVAVVRPFEDPAPPDCASNCLDLITLMFNYHDFGHMGVDRAAVNRAAFAALKAGGMYVIADHSGRPGTGISESGTLHRIEEAFLRAEVEQAGFKLVAEGNFLRNPLDPRDRNTPEPPQPKDEFVLKFVKP